MYVELLLTSPKFHPVSQWWIWHFDTTSKIANIILWGPLGGNSGIFFKGGGCPVIYRGSSIFKLKKSFAPIGSHVQEKKIIKISIFNISKILNPVLWGPLRRKFKRSFQTLTCDLLGGVTFWNFAALDDMLSKTLWPAVIESKAILKQVYQRTQSDIEHYEVKCTPYMLYCNSPVLNFIQFRCTTIYFRDICSISVSPIEYHVKFQSF